MRTSSIFASVSLSLALVGCGNKIENTSDDGLTGTEDTGTVIDLDQDGSPQGEDCDDGDASAYPGAEEICDDVDNDCDGVVDNDPVDAGTWYADSDSDGFGDADAASSACDQPAGTVDDATDCNDGDENYYPGAPEDDCTDPNDYNCDGSVGYADADGDGFAACEECDDASATTYPDAPEICDEVDNDCDDLIDADDDLAKGEGGTWYADSDEDGFGDLAAPTVACDQPDGTVDDYSDCNDADGAINPGETEVCNGYDDDCDLLVDDEDDSLDVGTHTTWYADTDEDGFGDEGTASASCDAPLGWTDVPGDCNDADGAINPDANEVCDPFDTDEDCDGDADDDDDDALGLLGWFIDYDSDGFGSVAFVQEACNQPAGYVDNSDDCDDTETGVNPLADEVCDSIDNDCDELIDSADDSVSGLATFYADSDEDGFGDLDSTTDDCEIPDGYVDNSDDCDDAVAAINPDATEICDGGIDNDCDDLIDDLDDSVSGLATWYEDGDSDEYGNASVSEVSCVAPDGYVANAEDCDDEDGSQNPAASEVCNDEDDDCDDDIDEDATDASWSFVDSDEDGFGDPASSPEWICGETVDNDLDCDDGDVGEPVVVATDGSTSGDGSIDSPFDSIQDGIDTAYDCVVVEAGTYYEAVDFGGADISVTSTDGPDETVIDASGLGGPAASFQSYETSDAVLSGFTLTGGTGNQEDTEDVVDCTSISTCTTYTSTYCGGAIFVDGSGPSLENLIIQGNELADYSETDSGDDTYLVYSYGGGICALGSANVNLSGVDIIENYADQGGGIYVDETSSVEMDAVWLIGNTATDGAGIQVDGGEATLDNVASMWNMADDDAGGILGIDGSLSLTNVTLAGDDGTLSGALYASGATSAVIRNSVLTTDSSVATLMGDGSATVGVYYSDIYNGTGSAYSGLTDATGSSGNISVDPVFTAWSDDGDWTNDDLAPGSGSPLIDAGDPDAAYDDVDGTTNDMGAWGGPNGDW